MMRIILSSESANFLLNHIRCEKKIAVEVMHNNVQMIGFIDAEELLHVGRKRVRLVVPLSELDSETMMKKCGYESTCLKTRVKSEIKSEIVESPKQSFIVIEMELDKALNEEIFEDSREILNCSVDVADVEEKFSFLRRNLQAIVRNLLANQTSPQKALQKAVEDGNFGRIKNKLLPQFHELAANMAVVGDTEEELQANFLCKFTSKVLHVERSCSPTDDQRKILAAKFYDALTMETEAEQIFLREIVQNRKNEVAWMNCGIYYMRKQYYDKVRIE
jgi:hypothetical protein